MPVFKITTDLLVNRFERELFVLNASLKERGLPHYYKGKNALDVPQFNESYRLYPEPRCLPTWRFPFIKLEEVYLTYFPNEKEQLDIVYNAGKDKVTKVVHSKQEND